MRIAIPGLAGSKRNAASVVPWTLIAILLVLLIAMGVMRSRNADAVPFARDSVTCVSLLGSGGP